MGSGGIAPPFLTPALDGGEWSVSQTCHLNPREGVPGTHCLGGWVGRRVGRDIMEKRKSLVPTGKRTPIPRLASP
jgi:hypothetical protein